MVFATIGQFVFTSATPIHQPGLFRATGLFEVGPVLLPEDPWCVSLHTDQRTCTTSSTAHSHVKCPFAAFRGVLVSAERLVGQSLANLLVFFFSHTAAGGVEKTQTEWHKIDACAQPNKNKTETDPQKQAAQTRHAGEGRAVSQSDPYHHLPCKAHLAGRPAPQTSAISTHFPVMRHITTLTVAHVAREAL